MLKLLKLLKHLDFLWKHDKMTQAEVIKLLKKHKKPLTSRKIAKKLGKSPSSVGTIMSKLTKQGEVLRKNKKEKWYSEYHYVLK